MELGRGVNVRPDILPTNIFWELRGECSLTLVISHDPQKGESGENGTEINYRYLLQASYRAVRWPVSRF